MTNFSVISQCYFNCRWRALKSGILCNLTDSVYYCIFIYFVLKAVPLGMSSSSITATGKADVNDTYC
jgi:hypothetical protein